MGIAAIVKSPPVRIFVNVALPRFTPVSTVFDISVFVRFASCIFTYGPTMYPPLIDDRISRYGDGSMGGACVGETSNRPECVFVKFTFVKFISSIRVNDMSVFERFAPLRSMRGPITYPPLTELCTYR